MDGQSVIDKPGNNEQYRDHITKKVENENDLNKVDSLKLGDNHIVVHYTKDNASPPVERVKFEGLSDEDVCSEASEDELKAPVIPDGGWGWVVVLASFLVSACADGLSFSYGLLQEEFTQYFEGNQSKISLIGSLFLAIPLLEGPIMSALVDRYGCRTMTMVAGVLSALSFLLASICNSVEMLCLTFGFMAGSAMGILYVTAVVSVAFWFDKRRNLAFSLASSGIGFGTLIYSPLTYYLLQIYDWRNTIVILAGTLLNMCVCGALMRTPEWLEEKQKRERKLSGSRRSSSAGSISSNQKSIGGESTTMTADELKTLLKSGESPEHILKTLATSIAEAEELEATTQMNAEQNCRRINSTLHLPTFIQRQESVPHEVIKNFMDNNKLYNILHDPDLLVRRPSVTKHSLDGSKSELGTIPEKDTELTDINEATEEKQAGDNVNQNNEQKIETTALLKAKERHHHHSSTRAVKDTKNPPQSNWLSKQITTDHHYFKNMTLYGHTMLYRGAMLTLPRYKLRALSLPDIYRNSMWSLGSGSDDELTWYQRFWETMKDSFNFKMFTEFHFFMFNLCMVILSVWFIVPYFFLKSFMSAQGMDGGEVMISIIGIASGIGIVALGWTGDQPWVNVTKSFAACLIVCGLSVAVYPLIITNYWALTVNSAIFGFSFASSYSYSPAILMKLVPLDYFTVAYGLVLLAQGIGHLVGPPIGGLLFDVTGTWDLTFYLGGFWLVLSGICLVVVAYTTNLRMCGQSPLLNDENEDIVTTETWYQRFWETMKDSFNFKMFTEFHFFMFNLCMVILSVWFIVPYFFLKSFMSAQGMDGGEVMISIIGIASGIGIVALGWTGDQPWVNVTKSFAACLIVCGLSVAVYPLIITNYWALTVNSAIFGFSFASSYSYSPAILMKLVPLDYFTVAYGLVLLAQGIGHLVGPPIGGLLFDVTGTWDLTFYLGGFWLVLSGICLVVVAYTTNLRMCGQSPLLNDENEDIVTTEV